MKQKQLLQQALLIMVIFIGGLFKSTAQTQFWSDTFEDSGAPSSGSRTPSSSCSYPASAPYTKYFTRVAPGSLNLQNGTYSLYEGAKVWAGEDIDASCSPTGTSNTSPYAQNVTISSINISGKTGLTFKGLFAADSAAGTFDIGAPTDYLIVDYRIDGGAWVDLIRFLPTTGGVLALETTGDSIGDGSTPLRYRFNEFSGNIIGTGTTLELRAKFSANGTGTEEMAIDNFRLFETPSCTAPTIVSNPPNRSICGGSNTNFSVSASGATTYQWQVDQTGTGTYTNLSNVAPYSGVTTSTLTITGGTAGMTGYRYRGVAINGTASCFTNSNYGTLNVSSISTSGSQTNVSCFGGSNGNAAVSATGGIGGYTYNWSPSGGSAAIATGLSATNYTVTVTDAIGCTATRAYTITQPTAVSGSSIVTNIACNGGTTGAINLTPSGGTPGYTFNWGGGVTTEDRTGLAAGTYTVIITDVNGCTGTIIPTVTQPATPISGTTVVTNVACNSGNTGAINLTPSGGASGYTFNWGGGVTTEDRTGLTAGTYTVIITDVNGCTATVNPTVTQPTAVGGSTVVTNVACFGGSNGAINLTPSGGTPGYTFNWLPSGPTTEDRTGLTAGTYTVQITDANGCTGTRSATVTQATTPVSGTTVVTNVSCFGGSNGSINLTPSGGTGSGYTFNWLPSGPTTEDRTALTAGTYTVVITDVNGCTGTVNATVTQPTSPVSGTTVVTNVACFGGSNGSINLTPSGGSPGYTFNWLPSGPTTEDRTSLTAGTYTVQITDANGCTGTVNATVTQPTSPVSGTTVVTNVSCFGGSNGSINLTPSGGTGSGYTFNWLPSGPTTEDRTGLTAGTYTVQITDPNGCTGTVNATVTQPTSPVSGTTVVTNVSCFGGSNGAINLTPSGGTAGYTFNWLPSGPTTEDRTGLTAGTYTVQITDANGCTGTVNATVTQPTTPVSGTTVVTNVSCFGGSNGAINLTPSGGTGSGYTFNWLPSGPTTEDRTSLTAGTYTVVITDANGCTGTVNTTVTQPTSPVSGTTVVTNVSCFGASNGSINLTPSGGTGSGYTFNWLPSGPTTEDRTSLTAGTYTVIITDANGCTGTVNATVTQPTSSISGTTTVTNVSCFGGSNGTATVTATGGTGTKTYSWAPSGGTGTTASGLTQGTYTVTITDANGCTGTATAAITQPAAIGITIAQTNVSCFGGTNGTATATVTGGTGSKTYSWSPSGGTGATASGLAQGSYTVTVTDANSCTNTAVTTITQPTAITATTTVTNVSCFGGANGTATVTAGGGTGTKTYSWAPSGGTGATASGLAQGTYTVTVTDANGCTNTATASITQPTVITATTTVTNVSCFGGSNGTATVTASGGTGSKTYSWAPSGGTGATASGLAQGTYTVTVTDANSCIKTATATITQPPVITITHVSQTNVSCNGGSNGAASITAAGGTGILTYNWTPGNPTGDGTASVTGLTAGTWTVTVSDANTCSSTSTFAITEATAIVVTPAQTNVSCHGACNGSASVTVTGGTPAYNYSWAPAGGTAATANSLCAGTYTVTVTDANGCTRTQTITITEPAVLTATIAQTNVSCFGGSNGTATVTATGGTGTKTYAWAPSGGTLPTASGLVAGTYTVTVTDANSCTTTQTANITQPPVISLTTAQTNVSCHASCNGTATVTASGGTGAFTYAWSPAGGTAATATGLCAGSYTVTVTDANGCLNTGTVTITEPSALLLTTTQTNVSCNSLCNGTATVNATGGTGAYSYAWSPTGGTAATASGLCAGSYTVTVTDDNSCSNTQVATISEPATLAATVVTTNVTCNGACNGTATVSVTGGSSPYSYAWTPGGITGASSAGLCAGTYTVLVTDVNGCTTTVTIIITEPAVLVANASATTILCNSGTATVTVSGTGGTTPYSGTGTFTVSAGTYSYTVTDSSGCSATTNMTIAEPAAITGSQAITVCAGGSVTVGTSTYNTDGTYTDVLSAANSCDSTVTTVLTVLAPINSTQAFTLCAGNSVTVGTNVYDSTGTYMDVLTSAFSCDSTVTTNLTILPVSSGSQTLTICAGDSVMVGSNVYTGSGTFVNAVPSANGCDSTVTTNLTVLPANMMTQTFTVCAGGSVTVGSNVYTITGTYTDVFAAANGCDSTVVTNLTVNAAIDNTVTTSGNSITANQNGATYQWLDCNTGNSMIAGATGQTFTAGADGNYAVMITLGGCSDTSACVNIIHIGIDEQAAGTGVTVYPNPANEMITVQITNLRAGMENTISLYDAVGRLVYEAQATAEKTEINLAKLPAGIYFIKLQNANGVVTKKITKQ